MFSAREQNTRGKQNFPRVYRFLLADAELGNDGTIALDVLLHQVVEKAATLTDHLVQAATGVVVVGVNLEVLGELVDALGENSDLDFGRTGVGLVSAVGLDDGGLLVFEHHSSIHLSKINSPGTEWRAR